MKKNYKKKRPARVEDTAAEISAGIEKKVTPAPVKPAEMPAGGARRATASTLKPPMGFHRFFQMLKIVLGAFQLLSLIQILIDGNISGYRLIDAACYGLFAALLFGSAWLHQKKTGVYLFFAYGVLELAYAMTSVLISIRNFGMSQELSSRLISYPIGSAVFLIPVYLYYKKRMYLLK